MKKLTTLKKTDTIKNGLELLKGHFGAIVCIVENKKNLLGIVTEGDLRRAIINGNSLDTKLEKVMNTKPTYIFESELKSKKIIKSNINLGAMMDKPLIIPIVNIGYVITMPFLVFGVIVLIMSLFVDLIFERARKLDSFIS